MIDVVTVTVNGKVYRLSRHQRKEFEKNLNDKDKALLRKYANL